MNTADLGLAVTWREGQIRDQQQGLLVDPELPAYRLTHAEARDRDLLCLCGDSKGDPGWYTDDARPEWRGRLLLPLRDTGGERGRCQCYRARLRQTPVGANR